MSYCLGIKTRHGLVMASDSRTSSGADQVNVCQKMHPFVIPGERVFVLLTTGSLSLSQSVITLLRQDFDKGRGLAAVQNFYEAARVVGEIVRFIASVDRKSLERDNFRFNVNILVGGQIRGSEPELYLIYPQGNPLRSTPDSPFLQIGESKYGRPILDRGISYESTPVEQAAKYALLSVDSTMRSNATVGPPVDLMLYANDDLDIRRRRRFYAHDADFVAIHSRWELALRHAVEDLPEIPFEAGTAATEAAKPASRPAPATAPRVEPMEEPPGLKPEEDDMVEQIAARDEQA